MIKKSQWFMVWLLPVIVVGGLFYPLIGYLVVAMIAFFLALSVFAGRYWCWNLCPRGAFLDIVMPRLSLNKALPKVFVKAWFRWLVLVSLMGFLVLRIIKSGGNLIIIGAVFVGMCVLTTIISIIIGVFTKHRGWCVICPMGFLQEKIGRLSKHKHSGGDNE
ncbi:MAG: 4Fe-4S binding protein [Candidatus Omnitrophica bacterium]|nr:4Fe-4S binding protein [Candidatus Omnitrophota bacterium]